jgi:hypothetical protein
MLPARERRESREACPGTLSVSVDISRRQGIGAEYGAIRHICGLAQRVPLPPVPSSAQRHTESIRQGQDAEAAAVELRQQLLDAIYTGQPFRQILRDPQT